MICQLYICFKLNYLMKIFPNTLKLNYFRISYQTIVTFFTKFNGKLIK